MAIFYNLVNSVLSWAFVGLMRAFFLITALVSSSHLPNFMPSLLIYS